METNNINENEEVTSKEVLRNFVIAGGTTVLLIGGLVWEYRKLVEKKLIIKKIESN